MAQIIDSDPISSEFFYLTGLPQKFGGGKNTFVINSTDRIIPDAPISVNVYDVKGNLLSTKVSRPANSKFGGETATGITYVTNIPSTTPTGVGRIEISSIGLDLGMYTGSYAYFNKIAYPTSPSVKLPLTFRPNTNPIPTADIIWSRNILIEPSKTTETNVTFFDTPYIDVASEIYKIPQYPTGSYVLATGSFSSTAVFPRNNYNGNYDFQFKDTIYQIFLKSGFVHFLIIPRLSIFFIVSEYYITPYILL